MYVALFIGSISNSCLNIALFWCLKSFNCVFFRCFESNNVECQTMKWRWNFLCSIYNFRIIFFLFLVLLFARSLNHVSAIFGSKRCTRFTRYFHRKIGEIEMSILKVSSSFSMQMSSAIWIYASPTMENVFGRRPCSDVGIFNVNTRVSTTGKNECLMSTFKTLWIEFFRIQMFPVYFQLKLNSIMLLKLSTLTILKMN